jgi:hypothetical protein
MPPRKTRIRYPRVHLLPIYIRSLNTQVLISIELYFQHPYCDWLVSIVDQITGRAALLQTLLKKIVA